MQATSLKSQACVVAPFIYRAESGSVAVLETRTGPIHRGIESEATTVSMEGMGCGCLGSAGGSHLNARSAAHSVNR
ncbi:hypothetical protein BaRGS_00004471 [Batillaria attramentaria]|uniref:Uncharacterized protein n=1 Tax=Batillaria attramentaria TaxID=370345 RepID=A0ABD0LXE2_9CAEN